MNRLPSSAFHFLAACLFVGLATPAQAYIGPGAGLTAVGAFIALVAAIGVAIVAFIWFPIRRLLRKTRSRTEKHDDSAADDG